MKWYFFCFFYFLLSPWAQAHESADLVKQVRSSIFKIYVTSQKTLHIKPWGFEPTKSSSGTGFLIGPNLILTNAHVIAYGKSIFLQKDKDPELRRAYVKFVAHDVDLALLSLVDDKPLQGLKALSFVDSARLGQDVLTIGFPTGGEELSVTKGVISRFDYRLYAHSAFSKRLLFQVDSAINHGNSGGPVFLGKKVLGVAFQAKMTDQNIGYVIPFLVVKRFLSDVKDGTYDMQPSTGLHVRKWGASSEGNSRGIEVTFVEKGSTADGVLKVGDRLLEIAGKAVGTDGKILLLGERVSLKVLFGLTQVGNSIALKVLRDGKELSLKAIARAYEPHFSSLSFERNPRYLSLGGLVFTPLTTSHLSEQRKKSKDKDSPFLNYLYKFSRFDPNFSHVKEFVQFSSIIVKGFAPKASTFLGGVVESFNNKAIKSLDHFHKLIEEDVAEISKLKFYNKRELLFIKTKSLKKMNEYVKNLFGIKKIQVLEKPVDGALRKEDLL